MEDSSLMIEQSQSFHSPQLHYPTEESCRSETQISHFTFHYGESHNRPSTPSNRSSEVHQNHNRHQQNIGNIGGQKNFQQFSFPPQQTSHHYQKKQLNREDDIGPILISRNLYTSTPPYMSNSSSFSSSNNNHDSPTLRSIIVPPSLSGWLDKKSEKGIKGLRQWQKRYFNFSVDGLMYSLAPNNNPSDFINGKSDAQLIPYDRIHDVFLKPKSDCRFDIACIDHTYQLLTATKEERSLWVDAIKRVRKEYMDALRRSAAVSLEKRRPVELPASVVATASATNSSDEESDSGSRGSGSAEKGRTIKERELSRSQGEDGERTPSPPETPSPKKNKSKSLPSGSTGEEKASVPPSLEQLNLRPVSSSRPASVTPNPVRSLLVTPPRNNPSQGHINLFHSALSLFDPPAPSALSDLQQFFFQRIIKLSSSSLSNTNVDSNPFAYKYQSSVKPKNLTLDQPLLLALFPTSLSIIRWFLEHWEIHTGSISLQGVGIRRRRPMLVGLSGGLGLTPPKKSSASAGNLSVLPSNSVDMNREVSLTLHSTLNRRPSHSSKIFSEEDEKEEISRMRRIKELAVMLTSNPRAFSPKQHNGEDSDNQHQSAAGPQVSQQSQADPTVSSEDKRASPSPPRLFYSFPNRQTLSNKHTPNAGSPLNDSRENSATPLAVLSGPTPTPPHPPSKGPKLTIHEDPAKISLKYNSAQSSLRLNTNAVRALPARYASSTTTISYIPSAAGQDQVSGPLSVRPLPFSLLKPDSYQTLPLDREKNEKKRSIQAHTQINVLAKRLIVSSIQVGDLSFVNAVCSCLSEDGMTAYLAARLLSLLLIERCKYQKKGVIPSDEEMRVEQAKFEARKYKEMDDKLRGKVESIQEEEWEEETKTKAIYNTPTKIAAPISANSSPSSTRYTTPISGSPNNSISPTISSSPTNLTSRFRSLFTPVRSNHTHTRSLPSLSYYSSTTTSPISGGNNNANAPFFPGGVYHPSSILSPALPAPVIPIIPIPSLSSSFCSFLLSATNRKLTWAIRDSLLSLLVGHSVDIESDQVEPVKIKPRMVVRDSTMWRPLLVTLARSDMRIRANTLHQLNTLLIDNHGNCDSLRQYSPWAYDLFSLLLDVDTRLLVLQQGTDGYTLAAATVTNVYTYTINTLILPLYDSFLHSPAPQFSTTLSHVLTSLLSLTGQTLKSRTLALALLIALLTKLEANKSKFTFSTQTSPTYASTLSPLAGENVCWRNLGALLVIIKRFLLMSSTWCEERSKGKKHHKYYVIDTKEKGLYEKELSFDVYDSFGLHITNHVCSDIPLLSPLLSLLRALAFHSYTPLSFPSLTPVEQVILRTGQQEYVFFSDVALLLSKANTDSSKWIKLFVTVKTSEERRSLISEMLRENHRGDVRALPTGNEAATANNNAAQGKRVKIYESSDKSSMKQSSNEKVRRTNGGTYVSKKAQKVLGLI